MDFDSPNLIGGLNDEERIRFYEILAHNLTVSVRGVWSDERFTDSKKVECLKWLNEIMHRVVMKAALLRVQKNQFSESDSWEGIKHCRRLFIVLPAIALRSGSVVSKLKCPV